MTERLTIRFAVGIFNHWQQLSDALQDLRLRGVVLDSFNCLALETVFDGKTILAPSLQPVAIEKLVFSPDLGVICCTSGPLAACLRERIDAGAISLADALGFWLLPRQAAYFQQSVEKGKILLWLEITDDDYERRACQGLLASSSNSVGVQDLSLQLQTQFGRF